MSAFDKAMMCKTCPPHRSFRTAWLPALALLLTPVLSLAQSAMLSQVEQALTADPNQAVEDIGHLLKPSGVKELQQVGYELRKEGLPVFFVTVPKGTDVNAVAETVFQDLGMGQGNILIVFDGERVYGKTALLSGHPEAFQQALKDAEPGFHLYYAKGLAQFAESLRSQIQQRSQGQEHASRSSASAQS